MIEEGKINLNIFREQAINTGNSAKTAITNIGEDFDPTEHMFKRAIITTEKPIEQVLE